MNIYLHDIPVNDAQALFASALAEAGLSSILGIETIPLDETAVGRVIAEPIWAVLSSPNYHASAMDGFAVRSDDTLTADVSKPLILTVPDQAIYLDTGDPLPEWANAVIPIENIEPMDDHHALASDARHPGAIRIRSAVTPWSHVRPLGEDLVATQLVLPSGHILRPVDLGAVAACGHTTLRVAKKPRVAVIPTGSELIPIGQQAQVGDIIEYNSLVLSAQVNSWGGQAIRYPITPDHFDEIKTSVLQAAADCDLVLINAGSSVGSEDFTAQVIQHLGRVLVHGVAVRPGHPVILGMIDLPKKSLPIIGVPGYPVSAALTGEIFVEPLLARWLGRKKLTPPKIHATLTRKVTSPPGDDDYLRVAVGRVGERLLAAPLSRGAGVISSLVRADGFAILPRGVQGLQAGDMIEVNLYRSPSELENSIFAIGSHDVILDLLAQYLARKDRRLISSNVGSQAGMIALRRGEAHFAGSHLLDPTTGEFNLSYIKQYLPGIKVKLITFVHRQQGLMVLKGNPLNISSLEDIFSEQVSFINRQRGAGTRVLLDYELSKLGKDPRDIKGYDQEEYTHLAVAAAIASGRASCGLGIASAAQALGLDFIPLFQERFDLVIPHQYVDSELLHPMIQLLDDAEFRDAVMSLPGYNVDHMGEVVV